MLIDIIAVAARKDYSLVLEFENGERRIFDMRPLMVVKPWDRIAALPLFLRASVGCGTVVWPGGVDIAPETLYDDSLPFG